METELKLLVDPADVNLLRQHPLLGKYAVQQPHERQLHGIYFDTADCALRKAGACLRVRKDGDAWVQTFKTDDQAVMGGLHQRGEWETKVMRPQPDLAALQSLLDSKSRHTKLIKELAKRKTLRPVFTTEVKRMVWDLRLPQGDLMECALDQGMVERNGKNLPISEFELELKSGNPAHLFDFALQLQNQVPMHINARSKADLGYGLLSPGTEGAVKAKPLHLSRKMNLEQAFQAIASNCLAQIQANEEGVAYRRDTESLHQMRVGLRRLRSALTIFKKRIRCPDEMQEELAWLGQALGTARDWDVLQQSTLPRLVEVSGNLSILAPLQQAAQEQADTAHEAASQAVLSPRYTTLMLRFAGWVEGAGWRAELTPRQEKKLSGKLTGFAGKTLSRARDRLGDRAQQVDATEPETRHRMRIAGKKTRYAAEFFESLYPDKQVRPYIKGLSALQDELGWLNDAAVGARLLQELEHARPDLCGDIGFARGFLHSITLSDDLRLGKLWKKFRPVALPSS